MKNKTGILLLVLLAIAFILRFVFCFAVVGFDSSPRGDEIDYHQIAANISSGSGFTLGNGQTTARRPPLYPVFLSGWYAIFGARVGVGRIIQLLLGTIIVIFVFKVAEALFGRRTAKLAAALTAVNPFLIFISSYLLTENLYICLLLALLLVFTREGLQVLSFKYAAIGGLLLGLCSLARPAAFILWPVVVGMLAASRSQAPSRRIHLILVFLSIFAITILPWALRNHARLGAWVLFTTHGGITFYQSNNQAVLDYPQYRGGVSPFYMLPGWNDLQGLGEPEKDRAAWRMGISFIKQNQKLVPVLVARKFMRFWRMRSDVGMSGIGSGWWWNQNTFLGNLASKLDLGFLYAILVLPAFVIGLLLTAGQNRGLFLAYGIIAVHTLIALVFFGSLRGRLPVEPVVAIFAAAGALQLLERIKKRGNQAKVEEV